MLPYRYCCSILLFLGLSVIATAQKEIIIKFTPDDFPQDISWELQTQDNRGVVASGDLMGCVPNEECVVFQEMVEDRCYTLLVRDGNGDGISMPGGYEVFFDNALVVSTEAFTDKIYRYFNCGRGETCEQAVVLDLPKSFFPAPDDKEWWFSFTPETDGHYRINTCLSTVTGTGAADTRLWFYDTCDRTVHQDGAEGALGFSNDAPDPGCPPGAGFNFLPMDGGVTYYIRHKPLHEWKDNGTNDSIKVRVQKLPVRSGCNDPEACNFDPFAQILMPGSCEYSADCAPDLALDEEELRNSIVVDTIFSNDNCEIIEGCLRGPGPREVIRFSTKIDNVGDADYVVGRPENDPRLFSQENCHGHYHHLGYAEYLLYQGEGEPEPVGFKSGFCVLDLDCSDSPGTLPKYICANMGITRGCSDIYEAALDCQWIDITDIEDGQYSIVIRVNHFEIADARNMAEKTYDNNVGQACVTIDRSSGVLIVTVDDTCPDYVDCQGVANGDAEIDCEGNCGGTAHFGDFNDTGELDDEDLAIYMDMLENKIELNGPCGDMNGDGELSIYDAALVYDCLQENIEQADNPFHEHCTFPAGNDLTDEMAVLRVTEFNQGEKYIDLDLWVADRDISAYQIMTSGIQISGVERFYTAEPSTFNFNNEGIFALHTVSNYPRNTDFEPFIRIRYSEITLDSLCITAGSEFINRDYNRVATMLENECDMLSATSEVTASSQVTIIPNPASDKITVFAAGGYIEAASIIDLNGKEVLAQNINSNRSFEVDVTDLIDGLYLVQLKFKDGVTVTERFMKSN